MTAGFNNMGHEGPKGEPGEWLEVWTAPAAESGWLVDPLDPFWEGYTFIYLRRGRIHGRYEVLTDRLRHPGLLPLYLGLFEVQCDRWEEEAAV